ncbi:MAG: TrbG/VirB9 family P-type conjugative transfer protein [Sphingomicrobium sp.]
MKRFWSLSLLLLTAASYPRSTADDPHLQTVMYAPNEVVRLRGAVGWQLMIEFGADERIENVSIGDALAWQVTPNKRAHILFLKPQLKNASTNMTVVTDRRQYSFMLDTAERLPTTPWVLHFDYPHEVVEAIEEPPPPPPPTLNFSYSRRGDAAVMPARVWDDGRMTYFEFAETTPLPAIFAGAPGKAETLINSMVRGRVIVVQQMGVFTLRSGDRIATIYPGLDKKR